MSKRLLGSLNERANIIPQSIFVFVRSSWFFPAALFLVVLLLSSLQINGSSIGIYHQLLYGDSKDKNLLLNEPRSVRSDEWLVTTQLTLGQVKSGFLPVNPNIGKGLDLSLLVDAPVADGMQVFKPHNLGFFVAPEGVAFAFKWWLLAYLLVISVYFFVLTLLPKRKKMAILLSLSMLASPFIVWWYQYITLAPIYYTLFGLVVAVKITQSRKLAITLGWCILLAYIGVSFVLVLYPPFQIPCLIFAFAFLMGYMLDNRSRIKDMKRLLIGTSSSVALAVALVAFMLVPKLPVVEAISDTAYPGNRIVESGGFNPLLFIASNTSALNQSDERAQAFAWLPNQSEGSNFILVFLLAMPLLVYLAIRYRKRISNFWMVMALALITSIFVCWLFIPNLALLGKITFLDKVLHERLLVGFGLINLLTVVTFIQILETRKIRLAKYTPLLGASAMFVVGLIVNMYIAHIFPGFMGQKWAALLAIPYPLILYALLKRHFHVAGMILLVFSIGSVALIHPLYKGVDVLTESEIVNAIEEVSTTNSKRWVTDSLQLENYAVLAGRPSLSGVYVYPDMSLWSKDFPGMKDKYNRYAHVHFQFDRNENKYVKKQLDQPSPDQLIPKVEPCDEFLKKNNVGYILTTQKFNPGQAPCAALLRFVTLPQAKVYIYELGF